MSVLHFGLGNLVVSATNGAATIGRIMNVSINATWEFAQLRGGVQIFADNTQFFDGAIDGSFQNGEVDLSALGPLMGGNFAAAGGSGTLTMTGNSTPVRFKFVFSAVTNGVTAIVTLQRVYIPNFTFDFTRTEYMLPQMNFICEFSTATGLLTWRQ